MKFVIQFVAIFSILFGVFQGVALSQSETPNSPGTPSPSQKDTSFWDRLSVGAGVIFYRDERIIDARVNEFGVVEVDKKASQGVQLLLEYHVFGKRDPEGGFFAWEGIYVAFLSGYGIVGSEDNKVIEGLGIGYTFGTPDIFGKKDALNWGIGLMVVGSVETLKDGVQDGQPLPPGVTSPTTSDSQLVLSFIVSFDI